MELYRQTLRARLAGFSSAGVKKFSIVVPHYNRSYRYNVAQRLVDEREEVISLTRPNKTVLLSVCRPGEGTAKEDIPMTKAPSATSPL